MTSIMSQPVQTAIAPTSPAVRASGLSKVIDDRIILRNLSFEIQRGEFAVILGANGAGKSTLLKILSTLITPTSGDLTMLDQPVRTNAVKLRSRIGLIGHGAMLYRDLSAKENLVFFGKLYGIANPLERAMQLLKWIGLGDRADDAVKSFSRGMTQRVAIARALMHEPELLLADEPFAGLDAPSTDMLEQMLMRLHDEGRTIILANHQIHQSLRLAERVLILRSGELMVDERAEVMNETSMLKEIAGT